MSQVVQPNNFPPYTLENVANALSQSLVSPNPSLTEYLTRFQTLPDAWAMTTQMLTSPPPSTPLHVFAAQTLKLKLKYDLHQHPSWRDLSPGSTFHALGTAYVTLGPSDAAVRNALASCLAVHAVQLWA
eukprot:CAMPEP_0182461948 /NCGR_PEP_ID=MMETSP1319-20130603/6377_1 /TAXON_ID=172717 /ORGANISM="Bolidomonas pacifica, Strain RCC208" /LENGTH=128 /DNA_ID=CAMNT_0024661311 /DNA_START=204 /DNA_END=587 /DNA_ORIENTATION=-